MTEEEFKKNIEVARKKFDEAEEKYEGGIINWVNEEQTERS